MARRVGETWRVSELHEPTNSLAQGSLASSVSLVFDLDLRDSLGTVADVTDRKLEQVALKGQRMNSHRNAVARDANCDGIIGGVADLPLLLGRARPRRHVDTKRVRVQRVAIRVVAVDIEGERCCGRVNNRLTDRVVRLVARVVQLQIKLVDASIG